MTTAKLPTGHNNSLHYFLTTKSASEFRREFEEEAKRLRAEARSLNARATQLEKVVAAIPKRSYKRRGKAARK